MKIHYSKHLKEFEPERLFEDTLCGLEDNKKIRITNNDKDVDCKVCINKLLTNVIPTGPVFIRLTFKDGRVHYVAETRKNMYMVDKIEDGFQYKNTLEFKVTYKFHHILEKNSWEQNMWREPTWKKRDIVKFESICVKDGIQEFDINEAEIDIKKDDEIHVDSFTFKKLLRCGITCSQWLYDKDDEWVAFPKEEDYKRITKIEYYKRGLTFTMTSQDNFLDRYDYKSWHSSYDLHHQLMLHPLIQQIALSDLDSCDGLTFYEDKTLGKYKIRK